jgi:hypothetical protein
MSENQVFGVKSHAIANWFVKFLTVICYFLINLILTKFFFDT